MQQWLGRDPIPMYRDRLVADGVDPAVLDAIDERATMLVDEATEAATSAPVPDASTLETEVWADGGSAWRS